MGAGNIKKWIGSKVDAQKDLMKGDIRASMRKTAHGDEQFFTGGAKISNKFDKATGVADTDAAGNITDQPGSSKPAKGSAMSGKTAKDWVNNNRNKYGVKGYK